MPQLVEYVNKENITPTDRGTEARVQEGRRVGAFFNQVAESTRDFGNRTAQQIGGAIRDAGNAAVDFRDHQQIHQGATYGAQMLLNLQNDKDDLIKGIDPNDPAYSAKVDGALKKWRDEKLEPALQQFDQGFTTEKSRAWSEHFIDQTRQHFYNATAADVSTAAGINVKNGTQNTLTSLSNLVTQDPSPSTLKRAMDLWEHSATGIVGSATGLKGTQAGGVLSSLLNEGHRKLVQDSASSGIQKAADPEAEAQKRVKDWSQYINGDEALKLARAAKTVAKANDLTDKQAAAFKRQQDDDAVKQRQSKIIADNVRADPATGKLTIKPNIFNDALDLVRNNPDAPNAAPTAQALINWGQAQLRERKENVASDPSTMGDLYKRLSSPDNPTTAIQILDAETTGKLSRYDTQNLSNLHKAIEDAGLNTPVFKATMRGVEEVLGVGLVDDGHERYANFMQRFIPEYQKLERSGASTAGALNLRDPNSMLSKLLDEYKPDPTVLNSARMIKKLFPGEGFGNLPSAKPGQPPGNTPQPDISSIGSKPVTVRQNGHTYRRQPDGSYKPVD